MTCPYKTTYGDNMSKRAPDLTRCCVEIVRYIGNWPHYGQCARKRGHGPEAAYCKQHDPDVAAKRRAEADARAEIAHLKRRKEWAGPRFFAVLKQIADGHNDPRALAREAISSYVERPADD